MKEVIQFFSEFYNMSKEDILKIVSQIPSYQDLLQVSAQDILSMVPSLKITDSHFKKSIERFKQLEEINHKEGISYITFDDTLYPQNLRHISSPPKILYYKGNIDLFQHPRSIGVVGSRKPTPYGKWVTQSLVKELVHNQFCIVSGFAYGIDSVSHQTALKNNGKTICVFGTPVHKIYPARNKKLYEEVLYKDGLIVSEHHGLKNTLPRFFAMRNRIISALSSGLLITEAGAKSGTLITANFAMHQGKYIFAVPGNINSPHSQGTNSLLKDGACMVTSIDDILFEYGYTQNTVSPEEELLTLDDLSEFEKNIYLAVKSMGQCHAEKIAMEKNISIQDVVSTLNILDIKGYISYDGFMANYVQQ